MNAQSIPSNTVQDDPLGWTVYPTNYEYSMSVTSVLQTYDSLMENTPGLILYAFNQKRECVGKSEIQYFEKIGKYRFPLTIFGNEMDEHIGFKVYQPQNNLILSVFDSINFVTEGIMGNYVNPVVWKIDTQLNSVESHEDKEIRIQKRDNLLIITFQLNESSKRLVSLFDIFGRVLYSTQTVENQLEIDISSLTPGIIILKLNYPSPDRKALSFPLFMKD